MSPERIEPKTVLSDALSKLGTAIGQCQGAEIGSGDLISRAQEVWNDLDRCEETRFLIEEKIKLMRLATAAILGTIDVSKGDPVRARIDPYKWSDLATEHVLDRSRALFNLLESIKSE